MDNFRVVLHMNQFFSDYRSASRLYITSKIKTINDLQKHISSLFDLNSQFYLIANNLYLPTCEDVRILKEDDVISAIPTKPDHFNFKIDKKISVDEAEVSSEVKKKKKKKRHESENLEDDSFVEEKKKKIKPALEKEERPQKLRGDARRKKQIEIMPILSTVPKVVKTLRIFDSTSPFLHSNGGVPQQNSRIEDSHNDSKFCNSNVYPHENKENVEIETKQPTPSAVLNVAESNLKSSATEFTDESTDVSSINGTKRKRNRVRKKKGKRPDLQEIFAPPTSFTLPFTFKSQPLTHIKFNEEEKEEAKPEEKEEAKPEENVVDMIEPLLCPDQILNYPVMKDTLPKEGDYVAFKICVLSQSYTPEISDFIITKILNYCSDTDMVTVILLEGGEQCCEPEGKFYMEDFSENVEENQRSFVWKELIEPRLLFP